MEQRILLDRLQHLLLKGKIKIIKRQNDEIEINNKIIYL